MRVSSYRQANVDDNFDAIVIGSGMGGLTTASLLARHARKRVLILEQHYTAGGFTHVFHRPGYEWDVGVHYIGQVHDPRSPLRGRGGSRRSSSRETSPARCTRTPPGRRTES